MFNTMNIVYQVFKRYGKEGKIEINYVSNLINFP